MLSVQHIANEFHIDKNLLIKESIKLYIHQQLVKLETELFKYAKKYGVKNVLEMDEKLKNGLLKEDEIIDDFFTFDSLEAERERLKNLLEIF